MDKDDAGLDDFTKHLENTNLTQTLPGNRQ